MKNEVKESLLNSFVVVTEENRRSIKSLIDITFLGETGAAFRVIAESGKETFFYKFASFIPFDIAAKRLGEFEEVIGFTVFDFDNKDGIDILFNDPSITTIEEANEAFLRFNDSVK